jgi:3'-phosphoadenosine 5'-phosphosulfate sulfotransferase (PAPS reductase)/FAD synthetase
VSPATGLASTPEIDRLIAQNVPIAVGVSGGKDSQAAALAVYAHLRSVGHTGPRVLIHSDLGSTEWKDSLPTCQRLANHLDTELIVVRRRAGDLMERWEARWQSSVRRYADLDTVTLVLPWSTPRMRFCTSELKTHIISAELRRRFPFETIVSVTGVRRAESSARARGTIAGLSVDGRMWTWRPLSDWSTEQVVACVLRHGLELHPAYTQFGLSRVSCRFCIMSRQQDLVAAAAVPESADLYRAMVGLEIRSTFPFQSERWLGDVAPNLLSEGARAALLEAKDKATARHALESLLTQDMLYVKGWPQRMLTDAEARVLAQVRAGVSALLNIQAHYLDAGSIHARYAQLLQERARQGVLWAS